MPHFMIVLKPYVNLLNLSWIKKSLFLRNIEASNQSRPHLCIKYNGHITVCKFVCCPTPKQVHFQLLCSCIIVNSVAFTFRLQRLGVGLLLSCLTTLILN